MPISPIKPISDLSDEETEILAMSADQFSSNNSNFDESLDEEDKMNERSSEENNASEENIEHQQLWIRVNNIDDDIISGQI